MVRKFDNLDEMKNAIEFDEMKEAIEFDPDGRFAWREVGTNGWRYGFATETDAIDDARKSGGCMIECGIIKRSVNKGDRLVNIHYFAEDEDYLISPLTDDEYEELQCKVDAVAERWAKSVDVYNRELLVDNVHRIDLQLNRVGVKFSELKAGDEFYAHSSVYIKANCPSSCLGYGIVGYNIVPFAGDDLVYTNMSLDKINNK